MLQIPWASRVPPRLFDQRNQFSPRIQGVTRTGERGRVRIALVGMGGLVGQYRRSGDIRTFFVRYALALLVTALALAATLVLRRNGPTPSFLFFVPAVAISAWYGGPGPSALATAVSLVLIDLNFFAPGGSLSIARVEALEIIAFLIVSATITSTMEALHRSRALAESRATELKRLNDEVGRS